MKITPSKLIQYAHLLSKSLTISAKAMSITEQHLHEKLLLSKHI